MTFFLRENHFSSKTKKLSCCTFMSSAWSMLTIISLYLSLNLMRNRLSASGQPRKNSFWPHTKVTLPKSHKLSSWSTEITLPLLLGTAQWGSGHCTILRRKKQWRFLMGITRFWTWRSSMKTFWCSEVTIVTWCFGTGRRTKSWRRSSDMQGQWCTFRWLMTWSYSRQEVTTSSSTGRSVQCKARRHHERTLRWISN